MTVITSSVQDNGHVGIEVDGGTVTVEGSSISGNASFGIENTSPTPVVQAAYNWWGHPSGPYHPSTNPGGLGDRVSDGVAYDPWLVFLPGSRWPELLVLDQPITASVEPYEFKDYYLVITAGLSLLIEVVPLSGTETLWTFSRHNTT